MSIDLREPYSLTGHPVSLPFPVETITAPLKLKGVLLRQRAGFLRYARSLHTPIRA